MEKYRICSLLGTCLGLKGRHEPHLYTAQQHRMRDGVESAEAICLCGPKT